MKKLFLTMLGVCAMLCSTSCSDEEIVVSGEGEAMVQFTVELSGADASRADAYTISDGTTVDRVYYEVYTNVNGTQTLQGKLKGVETINGKKATVQLALVKGQAYDVVFWASKEGVYDTSDLKEIKVKDQNTINIGLANDETKDAFTAVYRTAKVTGPIKETIYLTRPFAQINFGTLLTDMTDAEKAGAKLEESMIKVTNLAHTYNALAEEGVIEGNEPQTVTFGLNAIPNRDSQELTFGEGVTPTYEYLATAYVLFPGKATDQVTTDLTMTVPTGLNQDVVLTVPTAPAQRNYRTNVLGNLLTNTADFEVVVDPIYAGDKESIMIWDGKSVVKPAYDEATKTYSVKSAEELAWIANLVNGTLPAEARSEVAPAETLAGVTVKLIDDINLANQAWTPIGNSAHSFQGTFDGNGKTIHNLNVQMAGKSNAGLFGVTQNGEIKDLTVSKATVIGRLNVGVVAGTPYTSKYTNITVKGLVQVEGMAYVGGVGGKNAYANWDNVKVEVEDGSYVKANSVENGTAYRTYVGGVVGFNGEGGHSFTNITSNINVEGTTCDVGGLFGIAHYGNKFENCVCKGNVTITDASEAADAQEIGGIAGVWHNETGHTVTLTNCSFTGELSTNIAVEYYYGGLVGKPYSETGEGKLIINGDVMVATAAQLQAALDAVTGTATIKLGADIKGDVIEFQKANRTVVIDGCNYKYDGTIKIHNGSSYNNGAITIKNVNFETATPELNFVMPNEFGVENGVTRRYSNNVTVDNCTYTATGEAVNTAVGVQAKTSYNLQVLNCTATGMHSLLQAQSCGTDVIVKNATIKDGKNGVAFKQVKTAVVEGSTIVAAAYGIRFDGNTDNYGITVKDNNITAVQPFIVRKMTGKNNTIALEGENTLTTEETYQIVITAGSDDEAYVKPTGTYTLTGADGYKVFPAPVEVASWEDFTKALADGETEIKLTDNITYDSNYQLQKSVVIDLNGMSMTLPMINIHTKSTVKNGTINGKVYAQKNSDIIFDNVKFSGAVSDNLSTEGHLAIQSGCKLYAKGCVFSPTSVSGTQTKPLSFEGGSSTMKFENCEFKSSPYKKQVYFNSLSATATLDFTNCNFNNKTPNIMFAAACPLSVLTMSGTTKLGSVTLEINRAKDAVTEADWAHISTLIANNSISSVRLFYAGGSSGYIYK